MTAGVPFEAGGASYKLAFTMPAMRAYERESAETVFEAFDALADKPNVTRIGVLFRAACTPAVSEAEADALIEALGLVEAMRLIVAAVNAATVGIAAPNPPPPAS